MITNFDIFNSKEKYWGLQIRKDKSSKRILPYLEVPLEKLGMNDDDITYWKYIFKYSEDTDHVYLYMNKKNEWKYGHTDTDVKRNGYDSYTYGGEITYDKEDKENYKLKQTANRYNV